MAKKAFSDLISTFIESEIREKNVKSIVKCKITLINLVVFCVWIKTLDTKNY